MAGRRQAAFIAVTRQAAITTVSIILLLLLLFPGTIQARSSAEGDAVYAALKSGQRIDGGRTFAAPSKPTVYLTFDDGPSRLTPKVLDVLKEESVAATFFVLGEQVEARPEVAKRIADEGHALGNHSYNHVYRQLYGNFQAFWDQVQQTERIVKEAAGVRPRLVRAPGGTHGNFDAFYFYYLEQAGYQVYDWTIDSSDARKKGIKADEIYEIVSRGPFPQEAVVLMHDSAGHEETLKALPRIIRLFKEKGYAFAPLTPQVKPVQFSLGTPGWGRSVTAESHAAQLEEAQGHLYVWQNEPGGTAPQIMPAPQAILASSAMTLEPAGPDRLEIVLGSNRLTLAKEAFHAREGTYTVPLRNLVETMGGEVLWDGGRHIATARYGGYAAQYDFARLELRLYRPGEETRTYPLPDMALRDGTVTVPLERTLKMLGSRVTASDTGVLAGGGGTAEVSAVLYGNWWHLTVEPVALLNPRRAV
ncbi:MULTISPECIES: polysaccharide deacetylase family protein [Paenibacillus]|uniref:polysaccharide deacetylase family protein n=1 Tax=Paenibacillus TaxID=44249 RepID=UPI0022B8863A|nr:polysaccharide deacetylase family protein [Paenibacillus caseinilyticus]MCZ8523084.1 polysaccharide deacetylase [Paenibacillus caseinilyticus]